MIEVFKVACTFISYYPLALAVSRDDTIFDTQQTKPMAMRIYSRKPLESPSISLTC